MSQFGDLVQLFATLICKLYQVLLPTSCLTVFSLSFFLLTFVSIISQPLVFQSVFPSLFSRWCVCASCVCFPRFCLFTSHVLHVPAFAPCGFLISFLFTFFVISLQFFLDSFWPQLVCRLSLFFKACFFVFLTMPSSVLRLGSFC